jgi:predicted acyltransferase
MDQVRGYAVFGMVFVNVWGIFEASPWLLKHHETGYSYADTIAPLFIFVVGMGFRLSLTRRVARDGWRAAHRHAAMRYLLLMGLGLLYGGFNLRTGVWDALMDIGASGMLALPLLARPWWWRAAASVLYLAAYELLFRYTGYGPWEMANSINGGPLGPLSWVFLLLWGSIAWDIAAPGRLSRSLPGCVALAALFLTSGWLLHVPLGEFKPLWPFSQPWMTSPYTVFSAGLCFATVALFMLWCDIAQWRLPHLTALGRNPLFLYLLQALLVIVLRLSIPRDLPLWGIAILWAAVYTVVYGLARHFYRRGIVVKL